MAPPAIRPVASDIVLRERLDHLVATFDAGTITPDPLELVLARRDPADQEIVGLLAAAFAYGRADVVVANVGRVIARLEPSPDRWLRNLTSNGRFDRSRAARRLRGFTHRFHKTPDLVDLLERIALAIDRHGSLGALFKSVYEPSDPDIGPSLTRFVGALLALEGTSRPATPGLRYLLTSPADGSACKRMNLFLRWMVRDQSPDLGLWTFVDPAKLLIPLDTHVHRIATFLGLNERTTPDWKAARALTDALARLDPIDPVRYDFAICRLGILDLCSRRKTKEQCDVCLLRDVCRFPLVS